ncbi:MAG: hypothetical protein JXP34_05085 [Planctomycetes bacterium]|nr:hypothetical protein [Planctomycetota bacterium]
MKGPDVESRTPRVTATRIAVAVVAALAFAGIARGSTFRRADANADGIVDIADPVFTLEFVFSLRPEVPECLDALDANDDGAIDIGDAVFTLAYLFAHAEPPPWPFPGPGIDPSRDLLECPGPPPAMLELAGIWSGTFLEEEGESVVVIEIAVEDGRAIVAGGMESIGNEIIAGEIFVLDPPGGLYPYILVYATHGDRVEFLFDHDAGVRLLSGEFFAASGSGGYASLARIERPFEIGDATGSYLATFLDLDTGAMMAGELAFDRSGDLIAGGISGLGEIPEGLIGYGASDDPDEGPRRGLFEGGLGGSPEVRIRFFGYLAADTGIIAGWYIDPSTRNGVFLLEPAGEGGEGP